MEIDVISLVRIQNITHTRTRTLKPKWSILLNPGPRNTECDNYKTIERHQLTSVEFNRDSNQTFPILNLIFSGPCNNEYEFIVHQEHGSEEQEFILKAMKVDDKTHIPGKYTTALKSYDEMLENFQGISEYVIKELYKTYYR